MLKPIDDRAVKRLYQLTGDHNGEVFFITQRPATAGGTVQWRTHKWLVEHGFHAERDSTVGRTSQGGVGALP